MTTGMRIDSLSAVAQSTDAEGRLDFDGRAAAWPHMANQQRYGRVVVVVPSAIYGMAGVIPYPSAKGGALGLAKGLAEAGEGVGIKVNMIAPVALTRMSSTTVLTADERRVCELALAPEMYAP